MDYYTSTALSLEKRREHLVVRPHFGVDRGLPAPAAARALFLGGESVLLLLLLALVDGSGAAARGAARGPRVVAVVAALLAVGGGEVAALPLRRQATTTENVLRITTVHAPRTFDNAL